MIQKRNLLSIVAVIPLALGINLLTGQNFLHFHRVNDSEAALLGMFLELAAFGLILLSKVRFAITQACCLLVLQSPLLIGWGIIGGMFSGFGDGASQGAKVFDVMVWIVGGFLCAAIGFYSLVRHVRKIDLS